MKLATGAPLTRCPNCQSEGEHSAQFRSKGNRVKMRINGVVMAWPADAFWLRKCAYCRFEWPEAY